MSRDVLDELDSLTRSKEQVIPMREYPGTPKAWAEKYPKQVAMFLGLPATSLASVQNLLIHSILVENPLEREVRCEIYIGEPRGWRKKHGSDGETKALFEAADLFLLVRFKPKEQLEVPRNFARGFWDIRDGMIKGGGAPMLRLVGVEMPPIAMGILPDEARAEKARKGSTR